MNQMYETNAPNVTVQFDGLMVFTNNQVNAVNDYQARLHTQAKDHEVRIAVFKNGSATPYPEYVFSHEEMRNRFEHLWFYTINDNQPVQLDSSLNNMLRLEDLAGGHELLQLNDEVMKPIIHFKNGLLKTAGQREVCTLIAESQVSHCMGLLRLVSDVSVLDSSYNSFKDRIMSAPLKRLSGLPELTQLEFSLAQGDTLRLVSGDANGPKADGTVLLDLSPNPQEGYVVEVLNLPLHVVSRHRHRHQFASPSHRSHHMNEVTANHLLHYYDTFEPIHHNAHHERLVIVEDPPRQKLGPYPDPPCFGVRYKLM